MGRRVGPLDWGGALTGPATAPQRIKQSAPSARRGGTTPSTKPKGSVFPAAGGGDVSPWPAAAKAGGCCGGRAKPAAKGCGCGGSSTGSLSAGRPGTAAGSLFFDSDTSLPTGERQATSLSAAEVFCGTLPPPFSFFCWAALETLGEDADEAAFCALLPFPLNLWCRETFGLDTEGDDAEEEAEDPAESASDLAGMTQTGNCFVQVIPGLGSVLRGTFNLADGSTVAARGSDFGSEVQCVDSRHCTPRYTSARPAERSLAERFRLPSFGSSTSSEATEFGPGAYILPPTDLLASHPGYNFGEYGPASGHSDRDHLMQWLYLKVSPDSLCPLDPDDSDWEFSRFLADCPTLDVVSLSFPFAGYSASELVLDGENYIKVRLWVGVMHWVATLGNLPTFLTETLGGRIAATMNTVQEVQAWVNWKQNPDLDLGLGCEEYIEYFQRYPCRNIPIWGEIEAGGGTSELPINSGSMVTGLSTGGDYAEPDGAGYLYPRRPAFSFAGEPERGGAFLFSCMGRMVKAVVNIRCEPCDRGEFSEDYQRNAAIEAFECVFGGRVSAGVSLTYVPEGDTAANTAAARRCLTADDLLPIDDVISLARSRENRQPWLVEASDAERIEFDRYG